MQSINQVGEYPVIIGEPRWEEKEDKQNPTMILVLPLHTEDKEHGIEFKVYFNSTIIRGGKNKGKPLWEMNTELCHSLGMPKPFDPQGIGILEDVTATLVMEEDEYQRKKRVVPKYLNPRRNAPIEQDKVKYMWASITGSKPPEAQAPASGAPIKQDDPDDIPFT